MRLSIVHLNDVHGYLEPHSEIFFDEGKMDVKVAGGYSRIMSVINRIRRNSANTLVFDGGDTFHGTLPVIESKGEAIVPILNKIGFSAMVGHWDFGYGPDQLLKLNSLLNYPVLGINVYNSDGSLFLTPYIIKDIDNIKIAVIGICSDIIDKTMPDHFSEGLTITNGTEELPKYIEDVKEKGADLVFLLSHNGYPQDIKLLSIVKGIDVCLSAHTHNRLYEPTLIENSILIQCGCHGAFLGHLDIEIVDKKIDNFSYKLVPIEHSIEPDPEIEEMVTHIMRPYEVLKREVVGQTAHILERYNTLESSMDNLLLAAIQFVSKSDVAFSNGWRYGTPIPIGPITKWDLYNIIPMNPPVSTVELTGRQIKDMLEENLERTFSSDPMKQMGGYVKRCLGLSVLMRIENPKEHRIQEIYIGKHCLENNQTYKAAFVTAQGVPDKLGTNRKDLTVKVVDALTEFLQHNNPYTVGKMNTFSLI
jgi:S-sulfosulfanyl-L-cysteine sulfohydrolase